MNKKYINNVYAVFGNPIRHSKSPEIHNFFLKKNNFNENYIRICLSKKNFLDKIILFFKNGGKGANITLPFKEKVFLICNFITKRARLAGSINTIKKCKDGSLLGDNTDGVGFLSDLIFNKIIKKKFKILILGAGGAARGILYPLLEFGCQIYITNRTFSKAENLEQEFKKFGKIQSVSSKFLKNYNYDIIINSTSASLFNELPFLPLNLIFKKIIFYDMFYGDSKTCFLKFCKKNGARKLFNGMGMLINQAAHSFFLWKKIFPNIPKTISFCKKNFKYKE